MSKAGVVLFVRSVGTDRTFIMQAEADQLFLE